MHHRGRDKVSYDDDDVQLKLLLGEKHYLFRYS